MGHLEVTGSRECDAGINGVILSNQPTDLSGIVLSVVNGKVQPGRT